MPISLQNSQSELILQECDDILYTLKQLAEQNNISADELDFELKAVKTYKKDMHDSDFVALDSRDAPSFLGNTKNLADPTLAIMQRYTIKVIPNNGPHFAVYFETDSAHTHGELVFSRGFIFNESDFPRLWRYIAKLKAENRVLFVDDLQEQNNLLSFLKEQKYPIESELRYTLAKAVNLVPTRDCALEFRVVVSGYTSILKDEILCVYLKPLQGKPGRDIRGVYMIPGAPKGLGMPSPLRFDANTIKANDLSDEIQYTAIIGGIVNYDDGFLSVKDTLQTDEVSRKTGNLINDINSNSTINVTQSDSLKEAVGDGIKVQAAKVQIDGNIGARSEVVGDEVNIGGLTHMQSKIFSKNANIATHKGFVQAEKIKVETLEAGVIEGKIVEVDEVYGGKIYAEEIIIKKLHSNAQLHATKKIEVAVMKSGENKFFLSADYSPQNRALFAELENKRDSSIKEAIRQTKQLKIEAAEIKRLSATADETRKMLNEYRRSGKKAPQFLIDEFAKYVQMVKDMRNKRKRIKDLSATYEQLKMQLEQLDQKTKSAVVEILSGWQGYNEVHFIFHSPKKNFTLLPRYGEPSCAYFSEDKILLKVPNSSENK